MTKTSTESVAAVGAQYEWITHSESTPCGVALAFGVGVMFGNFSRRSASASCLSSDEWPSTPSGSTRNT